MSDRSEDCESCGRFDCYCKEKPMTKNELIKQITERIIQDTVHTQGWPSQFNPVICTWSPHIATAAFTVMQPLIEQMVEGLKYYQHLNPEGWKAQQVLKQYRKAMGEV